MASIDKLPDGRYRAIRRSKTQAWVDKLSETMAPGAVELVYRWVATIFKAAVGDHVIAAPSCIRIPLPKKLDTR
jgi:hypothetical protein